ncbi:MAG: MauE/DoxX family redox-associated membrane protein [Acidimicrobiales bacterium]
MLWTNLAAYLLAAIFLFAAITKIRRPEEVAADFAELGLAWPRTLAGLVPALELGCAVLLVAAPEWGGIASFALLAAFTAVLINVLRTGRVVACRCFGALSEEPVSTRTLLRNAALLTLAAIAAL